MKDSLGTPVFLGQDRRRAIRFLVGAGGVAGLVLVGLAGWPASAEESTGAAARLMVQDDPKAGRAVLLVRGKTAWVYRYGNEVDLPHYILFSPTGQQLTIEQAEPYPHHRSFWFADTVQLAGERRASFYNAWYSRVDKNDPRSPFRDRIRHLKLTVEQPTGQGSLMIHKELLWEIDQQKPVLDERRTMKVLDLGDGEYFLDIVFTLRASYGEVTFLSDASHYAWPYLRMTPEFSVQKGGVITNSEGQVNQKETNMQVAKWVDYSNTVAGRTEGVAVFSHSDNEHPHRWLTRDYGTFGPRRADEKSGKPFTLKQGETIKTRIGVLVHKGDVQQGRVAQRYQQYLDGTLRPASP